MYLRQGNVFTPVYHSVHWGCMADTSLGKHPPWADTLPRQTPPGRQRRPLQWTVCILLECILVVILDSVTEKNFIK